MVLSFQAWTLCLYSFMRIHTASCVPTAGGSWPEVDNRVRSKMSGSGASMNPDRICRSSTSRPSSKYSCLLNARKKLALSLLFSISALLGLPFFSFVLPNGLFSCVLLSRITFIAAPALLRVLFLVLCLCLLSNFGQTQDFDDQILELTLG
jgi:hypothetical protein